MLVKGCPLVRLSKGEVLVKFSHYNGYRPLNSTGQHGCTLLDFARQHELFQKSTGNMGEGTDGKGFP